MTTFFVATATIKDLQKFQEYAQKAGETLAPHQGELVLRGKKDNVLVGRADHQTVGIIKFPGQDALRAWFNSDAYQAIVPLREEAADMTIVTYSVPA
ncbi:hypothetical protein MNBD_GAMMA25-552 [hydrothermal vent metagenome]|uniref:DUF1330 domain-containing protein n=1 Tax=hydrothermal vent metagenome TaxID=652676 RepID=A0A3B1B8Y3_9ZZZZ